jgi:hypothetical protein
MLRKVLLRAGVEFKRLSRRPFSGALNPFEGSRHPVIIHCCYHKAGTKWFVRVMREVAAHFGLDYSTGSEYESIRALEEGRTRGVFMDYGSHVRLDTLGDYIGSHMIRDPRDMVVSGYFFHLWTSEPWAALPLAEHRGMSYREYLNSLDQEEGLLVEIRRMSFWVNHMLDWDYQNPNMFEIRYEDIMEDEEATFRNMFQHYGFTPAAVDASCRIAARYTFKKMSEPGALQSHLRSGKAGEWKQFFGAAHRRLFKELYPGAVVRLGYEGSKDW